MDKIVMTGDEIISLFMHELDPIAEGKMLLQSFLVLPSGIDKLEEMLKKELDSWSHSYKVVDDVFARFKQDNGLVNTEGMKKEHGIKEE